MAALQYKSPHLHHNKNLRKGINVTGNYDVKQLPSLILGVYRRRWLGSAFLLPKLASTTKQQRKQSVLVCSTFSHLCLVLPPIGFGHVRGLHAGNDSRRVVPHCYPHFSLPAGSRPFSRPRSAHKEPQDCICLSSVTCHGQEADITASPDNGGCCCSLT